MRMYLNLPKRAKVKLVDDDRLTGPGLFVNLTIQASRVQQLISSNWAKVYSRIPKLELNSSETLGEFELCDLGLLDTIYLVRPNQCKPSLQFRVHLCCIIIDEVMFQFMEGLAITGHCGCPSITKNVQFNMQQHNVAMHVTKGKDSSYKARCSLWDMILSSLIWFNQRFEFGGGNVKGAKNYIRDLKTSKMRKCSKTAKRAESPVPRRSILELRRSSAFQRVLDAFQKSWTQICARFY